MILKKIDEKKISTPSFTPWRVATPIFELNLHFAPLHTPIKFGCAIFKNATCRVSQTIFSKIFRFSTPAFQPWGGGTPITDFDLSLV